MKDATDDEVASRMEELLKSKNTRINELARQAVDGPNTDTARVKISMAMAEALRQRRADDEVAARMENSILEQVMPLKLGSRVRVFDQELKCYRLGTIKYLVMGGFDCGKANVELDVEPSIGIAGSCAWFTYGQMELLTEE